MSDETVPKLFVSYSWGSPEHEAWVVGFAEELVSQGIHVILDKWDLQPGHDAYAFMEGIVADSTVTKVVLICDKKYKQKSDSRSGGVGTEAQIITPELYAKTIQDKFVAVIRERDDDGNACVPIYYRGRIHIDLLEPSTYSAEFDRLVRWAWGQPVHIRPERGAKPKFLTDGNSSPKIISAVAFRRATEAVRSNLPGAANLTAEYFSTICRGMEAFRISISAENRTTFDDVVVESIDQFLIYRNELTEMFGVIAQYNCEESMLVSLHRFFEQLLPYTTHSSSTGSWNDIDFDNFRFIVHELFLSALGAFLKFEKFDAFLYMVDTEYFWNRRDGSKEKMHSYVRFREYLKSLEYRNNRLKLRRLSIRADMLEQRSHGGGINFKYIMAADFILYLRSNLTSDLFGRWWPETLLYSDQSGGIFEVFARSKSAKYFNRVKGLIQVKDKEDFGKLIMKIHSEPGRIPSWDYNSFNIAWLTGFESIATTP